MHANNFSQSKKRHVFNYNGNRWKLLCLQHSLNGKEKKKGKLFGNSKSLYLVSTPDPVCVWMEVNTEWYRPGDFSYSVTRCRWNDPPELKVTCLFQLRAEPTLMALLMCSAFSGCYCKGESVNLDFSPAVKFGSGYEKSPLQHGGFGCLGRLRTQAMKCLFMVMSLNPALLISAADFTGLRQR